MNEATMCTLKTLVILQEHLYSIYRPAYKTIPSSALSPPVYYTYR